MLCRGQLHRWSALRTSVAPLRSQFLLTGVLQASCKHRAAGVAAYSSMQNVSPQQAAEMVLESKATYLDVRTPQEFSSTGHVSVSLNVPWLIPGPDGAWKKNEAFLEQAASALPDKEAPIVVSCQAGRRGVAATEALLDAKYTNLVHLEGGLNAWAAAGLPVEQ